MVRVCWSRPNVVFMMHNFYVTGWVCCLYCRLVILSVPVFQIAKWFRMLVDRNMDVVSSYGAEHVSFVCENVEKSVRANGWWKCFAKVESRGDGGVG